MAYKIGLCPCCDDQIMIKDTQGKYTAYKPNFRQADIFFESGTRMRTIICEDCLAEDSLSDVMEAIMHPDSEACNSRTIELIKSLGVPLKIELNPRVPQGRRLGV